MNRTVIPPIRFWFTGIFTLSLWSIAVTQEDSSGTIPTALLTLSEDQRTHAEIVDFHRRFTETWAREIDSVAVPALRNLREKYLGAVDEAREKARAAGDLKATLALTEERDTLKLGELVGSPDPESEVKVLRDLREVFHRSSREIMINMDEKRKTLLQKFADGSDDLSISLTKQDKLAAAVAATELRALALEELKRFNEVTVDLPTKPEIPLKPIELPLYGADDHLKSFNDLTKLLPLGFELNSESGLDLEKVERLNLGLRPQTNRIARWLVTLEGREPSSLYGGREKLISAPSKIKIGGREFIARVNIHHDNATDFAPKAKGNSFEVIGRVAFCQLSDAEGGLWRLDIGNARLQKPNDIADIVDRLPDVKILKASWGSGGSRMDVTARVAEQLIFKQNRVSATRNSMGGDPAPYWQKNLSISFLVGESKSSISLHEGSSTSLENLFKAVETPRANEVAPK